MRKCHFCKKEAILNYDGECEECEDNRILSETIERVADQISRSGSKDKEIYFVNRSGTVRKWDSSKHSVVYPGCNWVI